MPTEDNFLYNKEEFLSTIENATTRSIASSVLRQCAPYEEKYNTPLCEMSLDMLQDIFSNSFGNKLKSMMDAKKFVKKFFKWQYEVYGVKDTGEIDNVKLDSVGKMRKSMVSSPLHLSKVMDAIFHPVEKNTQHNAYRSLLWLVYMGFTFAEAVEITFDEVDFDSMTVSHGNKKIEIYHEAYEVFKRTKKAKEFVVDLKRNSKKARQMQDNYFVCGISKSKMSLTTLSSMLAVAQQDLETEITVKSIEYSGIFFRTFEIERATRQIDFVEAARLENTLVYNPENPGDFKRKLRELNAKYRADYETWKRAF